MIEFFLIATKVVYQNQCIVNFKSLEMFFLSYEDDHTIF